MKIAVIGSGGREHAIAWKLAQSVGWENIYVLPGNGGIPRSFNINFNDFEALEAYCRNEGIGLIVVGPEQPLANGIVDYFRKTDIRILGPTKAAAIMEGSKIFAKQFMRRHGVVTSDFELFDNIDAALPYIQSKNGDCVIKYDGLAAGKGVFVCNNMEEANAAVEEFRETYGDIANFIVEDKIVGDEISIIGLTDGKSIKLFPASQDHKQVYDNDLGPNTGGMGAFCPAPFYTESLAAEIDRLIVQPTLAGIQKDNLDYKGFIYFGVMMDANGPKLLEYNARLGDPETEVLLPALDADLVAAVEAAIDGTLGEVAWNWHKGYFVDVVLTSGGYPKSFPKGFVIKGLEDVDSGTLLFYAGVKRSGEDLVTDGGRVINVVCQGATLEEAIENTYRNCNKICFEGMHYRKDIGSRVLKNKY
jgi:phosphoribosylamine---glycine ligase